MHGQKRFHETRRRWPWPHAPGLKMLLEIIYALIIKCANVCLFVYAIVSVCKYIGV